MAERNQAKAPAQAADARIPYDAQTGPTDGGPQRLLAQRSASSNRRLAAIGGGASGALLIDLALIWYSIRGEPGCASNAMVTLPAPYSSDIPTGAESLGSHDATVVPQEWRDGQCRRSGLFTRDTEQQLIDDDVSTGPAHFEFHDFPFLGQFAETTESRTAARRAGDRGTFWDDDRALSFTQEFENTDGFATQRPTEIASEFGLDTQQFGSCLANDARADEIHQNCDQGTQPGINQTPTFFVNGQRISGANDSQIQQALDTALAGQ